MKEAENLKEIGFILIFIINIIYYFIKIIILKKKLKSFKTKEEVEKELCELVEKAECLFESGIDKKEYVLDSISQYLKKKKINIDYKEIDKIIENVISVSKQINYQGDNNES